MFASDQDMAWHSLWYISVNKKNMIGMIILIGGFMKQLSSTKQKWVLSLALLAVLGSQSYFQVHSNQLNVIELASEAKAETKVQAKPAVKEESKKAESVDPKDKKIEDLTNKVIKMEAALTSIGCTNGDCSTALLKKPVNPLPIDDEDKVETKKERSERIAKEKKEKKIADEKEKKDKLREDQATANDEFKSKMESISDDCSDGSVACLAQRTVEILAEYSGKGVVKPDARTVSNAFNKYVGDSLRAGLTNGDIANDSDLQAAIRTISSDMPMEYRNLKERTLEISSAATLAKAQSINTKFTMAKMYQSNNRINEAITLQSQGIQERDRLTLDSQVLVNNMQIGTEQTHDNATMQYLQSVYLPNINKTLTGLLDISGKTLNSTDGTPVNADGSRSNARGSLTSKLLNNNGDSVNSNNSMIIGSPTSTRQLNRTGRSN